jgi:hypothetical protein
MRRTYLLGLIGLSIAIGAACSSTTDTGDGGTDAANDVTTPKDATSSDVVTADVTVKDSATDSANDATTSDASDGGAGDGAILYTLTIDDYANWCSVIVQDGGASTLTPQTFQFAPSTLVSLFADTAGSTFVWGYWKGTNPDGGNDTTMSTGITMTGDKNIQACCPLKASPKTPCP